MKTQTYLALGALVVAGGATALKLTHKDPHASTGVAKDSPLPSLKKTSIDEISILEKDKPEVVLKKDGAEWKLVKPVADRADQAAVDGALDALEKLKLRDVIAEHTESYDKVGVKDDDVVKVIPRQGGKDLVTLLVGKTTNVRLNADPRVWSTVDLRRWELVKEAKLWRDREVMKIEPDKLAQIEVAYDAGKVVVKKEAPPAPASQPATSGATPPLPTGPDKWTLVEGADKIGGPIDANAATGLAATLTRLDADDFAKDDAKPEVTGLDHPRATLTATLKDGTTKVLQLGKEEGNFVYAKRPDSPRVWTLRKWDAERIPASPAQWREKTLLKIAPNDIVKVEFVKGADKVVAERADADKPWKATAPADFGEVEPNRITAALSLLTDLTALRIVDSPDAKVTGLDKPQGSMTVVHKNGASDQLVIGAKDDKTMETYVQLAGKPDVYVLPGNVVGSFLHSAAELKKPAAAPAPAPGAAASGAKKKAG